LINKFFKKSTEKEKMRKDTIKLHKAIARKEMPIPAPKIETTKKKYNRKKIKREPLED